MTSYYKQGEDCLTLNIWRNISNTNLKKPVMIFIHGGAFERVVQLIYYMKEQV